MVGHLSTHILLVKGDKFLKKSKFTFEGLSEKDLLSVEEGAFVYGLGVTRARQLFREADAMMKIGRRTLIRRKKVDAYLDKVDAHLNALRAPGDK